MLKNDLLLRAARGEKTDRVPVWIMRQAGRILPEYRAIRESLSGFTELVQTPELSAEVTIQPVDILGVDAAIIFSDILVIPEAMGLPYHMEEKKGPVFPKTIASPADINLLHAATPSEFGYVGEAIKITKQRLAGRVPIIGFAGAPFTIFCYMVEGGGSKTFSKSKRMLFEHTKESEHLLEKITEATITYLQMQVQSGADLIQIFDSWAGLLTPHHYELYSLKYQKMIVDALKPMGVPVTLFGKGAMESLAAMAQTGCDVVGIDWNIAPENARLRAGTNVTLQGNLDPTVLYGTEEFIASETKNMIDAFGKQKYIANLGHGVYPDSDWRKVKFYIDTIKAYTQS
jgi:uroporphyrinogen decarboxylase